MSLVSGRHAGFWIRVVAYIVDALILGIVGGLLGSVSLHTGPSDARTGAPSLLLSILYFGLLWSNIGGGQTLGMRIFKLKVVGSDGRLIGVGRALLRWLMLFVSFLVCSIGVVWVAFDPRSRDGTTTWRVRTSSRSSPPRGAGREAARRPACPGSPGLRPLPDRWSSWSSC